MDIKDLKIKPMGARPLATTAAAPGARARRAGTAARDTDTETEESVTLTATGRIYSAVLADSAAVPFDSARVADIKKAIAEGRYPIDNRRLAEKLIEFERLLD